MSGFMPASRDWSMRKLPKKAAVTYTKNAFLYNDETDNVPVVDATQNNVLGIIQEAKASSATTEDIYILEPNSVNSTFYGDMDGSETIAKTDEGDQFDFATGSGDDLGVTVSTASTYDTLTLVKFISSSKGVFKLNVLHGKD